QSSAERADRLGVVPGVADRVRSGDRLRHQPGDAGGHRAIGALRRARPRRSHRPRQAMIRLIVLAFVATLALAGCAMVPGRPRPDARELAPTEVMAFDALYARNCAGCHGAQGRLGAARALNDPVYLALVSPERLRQVIAVGIPGTAQPAFALSAGGPLTDEQID